MEKPTISIEEYFAVDYVHKFYIGRVIAKEDNGYWQMKFLRHLFRDGAPVFNWPKTDDIDKVHESAIFYGPISLMGSVKDFEVVEFNTIDSAFKNID